MIYNIKEYSLVVRVIPSLLFSIVVWKRILISIQWQPSQLAVDDCVQSWPDALYSIHRCPPFTFYSIQLEWYHKAILKLRQKSTDHVKGRRTGWFQLKTTVYLLSIHFKRMWSCRRPWSSGHATQVSPPIRVDRMAAVCPAFHVKDVDRSTVGSLGHPGAQGDQKTNLVSLLK